MSIEIVDDSIETIELHKAILIYGQRKNICSYATIHPVEIVNRRPLIRAGIPVDRKHLGIFAESLSGASRSSLGLLPPNVLSVSHRHVVWWSPPTTRPVFFKMKAQDPEDPEDKEGLRVGSRNGKAPQPGLIFVVSGEEWFVFAVKGGDRPTITTEIYVAPYFNVWLGGKICTGNVRLPKSFLADQIQAWESAFFDSNFTHPNSPYLTSHPGGIQKLWIDLLDGKFSTFPEKSLVPLRVQAEKATYRRKQTKKVLPPTTLEHLIAHFERNAQ